MLQEKKSVTLTSVAAAVFLTGVKLAVGLATGSLGILSEAAHSGLDLLGSSMTFFAVRFAGKSADTDHPYGHEKFENLSALFSTLLLLFTCLWIIYEAVERLFFQAAQVEVNAWSYGVCLLAIAIDFSRSRVLYRVAKKTHSPALEADALHFSSDIYSSLVVLAGLVMTQLGYPKGDAIAAVGVSLFILWVAGRLGKRAVDKLVDRVAADHVQRATESALGVPGVRRAYDVRVREAGAKHFVDLKVALDRGASLERTHEVTEAVERAIQEVFRQADVVVHAEPDQGQPRGLTEEIFLLAERAGARPHALQVDKLEEGLDVEIHLEWPCSVTFAEGHGRATELEERILASFPEVRHIQTHLECSQEQAPVRKDVTAERPDLVAAVERAVLAQPEVERCWGIRLLEAEGRLLVALSCSLPAGLTLHEAHTAASEIESRVRALSDRIISATIHTEPGAPAGQPPSPAGG